MVKNLPADAGEGRDVDLILGSRRSPGGVPEVLGDDAQGCQCPFVM